MTDCIHPAPAIKADEDKHDKSGSCGSYLDLWFMCSQQDISWWQTGPTDQGADIQECNQI